MFNVGIIGVTGYVGVELLRLLLHHPNIKISAISSSSYESLEIAAVYKNFLNSTTLICQNKEAVIDNSDIIFTALPHGLSEEIAKDVISKNKILIDLGADFRLSNEEEYKKWYGKDYLFKDLHKYSTYALPELNRKEIKNSKIIANPGCYPTSISLGLMPLLSNKLININKDIICDSKSGLTGAGRGLSLKSHYTEANENFAPYNIGCHRHTPEIEETLSTIAGEKVEVIFTPHLLPVNRGILSTIYCNLSTENTLEEIHKIYSDFFKNESFVHILPLGETAEIKHVKYSNNCFISLHQSLRKDKLIIVSTIDNMLKGAAGQAIQNLNIILGIDENTGLNLISPCF